MLVSRECDSGPPRKLTAAYIVLHTTEPQTPYILGVKNLKPERVRSVKNGSPEIEVALAGGMTPLTCTVAVGFLLHKTTAM